MPSRHRAIVLDSWAVMAFFEDEPAGEKVFEIIVSAHERGIPLLMAIVNVGEIFYIVHRRASEKDAEQAVSDLSNLGIKFVLADWSLTREAAVLKATHALSYADCFAAALARLEKADIVTGDKEFKCLEKMVKIHWV